jgi:ribosomal protein S18 acetylase RimI-like enzyme
MIRVRSEIVNLLYERSPVSWSSRIVAPSVVWEPMEIREVRPEEYEEAGRITSLAYREFAPPDDPDWEEYLGEIADVAGRAALTTVLVAVEDGRILGTATVELDHKVPESDPERVLEPGEAHLRMLGVDPAARGRGVGRALVEGAIEVARERGKTVFRLTTTRMMTVARGMYERMGFQATPERDRHFESGFVLYAYEYPLER